MPVQLEGTKTYREIGEQAIAWEKAYGAVQEKRAELLALWRGGQGEGREALFTGCGTSYHLATAAASSYQILTGRAARAVAGSETFLFPEAIFARGASYLFVPFSRSGETSETVRAAEFVNSRGLGDVVSITGNVESPLAAAGSVSLVSPAAHEESLVMTKSFSSMLLMAEAVAALVGGRGEVEGELSRVASVADMQAVVQRSAAIVREVTAAKRFNNFVFLGAGPFYGLACEGTLKIKETAYAWSEAYNPLEFRHGPKAIVDGKTLVVALISDSGRRYEAPLIEEVKGYGATVLAVAENGGDDLAAADCVLEIRSGLSELGRLVLYAPVLQYLGCAVAVERGLDPDHPRNLTSVVRFGGEYK